MFVLALTISKILTFQIFYLGKVGQVQFFTMLCFDDNYNKICKISPFCVSCNYFSDINVFNFLLQKVGQGHRVQFLH